MRYIALMSTLRPTTLSIVLIFACLLPGCSTPAPAQPQDSPAAGQPQPGPSYPAGATPALGSHAQPVTEPPAEPPAETVAIRGRVIQTRRNSMSDPPVGTVRVEGTLESDTLYAKATIHVSRKTRLFLGRNGKPASFSFLQNGDLVEVTFTGPVEESDPVKATAARIVILEHKQ